MGKQGHEQVSNMKKPFEISGGELRIPLVGNIPHSSTYIEPTVRPAIVLNESQLQEELIKMTDWYTDELFTEIVAMGGVCVKANHSRLVLDTERYEDDSKEVMARRGMGVIYTTTSGNETLRAPLDAEVREVYLQEIYRPYHAVLEECALDCVQKFGKCLIIDCHSFPSKPLPYEIDQNLKRPEICIGTDRYHTPPALTAAAVEWCIEMGVSVEVDRPFSGSMVPSGFYTDTRVSSLMIEVRRDLYSDEATAERSARFLECQALVSELVRQIVNTF